jgi:arsenate reductase (thioredoxin)
MLLSETQSKKLSTLSMHKPLNLLVLCTGNSARSVMAEALFNQCTAGLFSAHSAGSHPSGKVNPFAIEQIAPLQIDYQPRSKNWDEFAQPDAVNLDLVLTVCGNAAQEICPNFIGAPQHVHWGLPDPAAVTGSDDNIRRAFYACYSVFAWRINKLMDLYATTPNANLIELMRDLANQYPLLPEINEHGFTSVIQ